VRKKTLWLLEGVTDEMSRFAAPQLINSILWHAGHVLVVVEHLAVSPATGQPPQLPAGWLETFGWDSRPQTVTQWPPISEVVARLREQLPRLSAAQAGLSPEQLAQIVEDDSTLHYEIVHALHDEANHQGEMWLLRKMYAKHHAARG
jgi:hypothetical protein